MRTRTRTSSPASYRDQNSWSAIDRASYEQKQVTRERDQRLIDSGKMTALEVSQANSIATVVVKRHGYRPSGKIGLPR